MGRKKGRPSLVEFTREPFPKKREMGASGQLSKGTFPIPSRENHRENGWCLKRTMVEKNGWNQPLELSVTAGLEFGAKGQVPRKRRAD